MPVRVNCPRCSIRLEADADGTQTSVRCPECGAVFAVGAGAPARRRARPAARRRPNDPRGLVIVAVAAAGLLVLLAMAIVGGVLLLRGRAKGKEETIAAAHAGATGGARPGALAGRTTAGSGNAPSPARKKYVPGVSEKELEALLQRVRREGGDDAERQITEEQVYAIMGEPTSRKTPVTVQRGGRTLTVYEARWEHHEPARQLSTVITFVNGRFGGGIIGLEVTPRGAASAGRPPPSQPPPAPDRPVTLSKPPAELLAGAWEADVPPATPPRPGQPKKVRVTFGSNGSVLVEPEPASTTSLSWRGTWKAERSEPPRLWAQLDLRRVGTREVPPIGNPVLFTFRNEDEFESAWFVALERVTFRRVSDGVPRKP